MEVERFEEFKERMLSLAESTLTEDDLAKKYKYDIEIGFDEISAGLIRDIETLRPFGKGNPLPSFVTRNCLIGDIRKLKSGQHIKFFLESSGNILEGIMFNVDSDKSSMIKPGNTVDILYELGINSWMGKQSIQVIIRDLFQKN
jgi:single-stranded-DNA-specific exonuclease